MEVTEGEIPLEEEQRQFNLFPEVPIELRLEIWRIFIDAPGPRRVILRRHSARPAIELRSPAAALLVNKESRRAYLDTYSQILHDHGQPRIHFNFSRDTLCLRGGCKSLRRLVKQYPEAMSRVQYLDVAYNHNHPFDGKLSDPGILASLRLVTLRTCEVLADAILGVNQLWMNLTLRFLTRIFWDRTGAANMERKPKIAVILRSGNMITMRGASAIHGPRGTVVQENLATTHIHGQTHRLTYWRDLKSTSPSCGLAL